MSFEYDAITAGHYAAYRPELHNEILKKCITNIDDFSLGIDIGCGTGHSSIALSKFCKKVIGIDPSENMIENAIVYPNVKYQKFTGQILAFEPNIAEIVTFAGSLHYAKSQQLLNEVVRVTKNKGLVIVYDFEMLLDDILRKLGLDSSEVNSYDHEADFSGLSCNAISLIKVAREKTCLDIIASNLAHLLLSVKEHYQSFEKKLEKHNLRTKLSEILSNMNDSETFAIVANLYYKVYSVSK